MLKPGAQLPESDMIQNIQQAYIANDQGTAVRVRLINTEEAYLTIKQASEYHLGIRTEFEYPIPVEEAIEMTNLSHYHKVVKQRHVIMEGEYRWEVDFFLEDNEGLILAEIELPSIDTPITLPEWVGKEVTHDERYLNNYLAKYPYSSWEQNRED